MCADGEVVWSWRPMLASSLEDVLSSNRVWRRSPQGNGGNGARLPEESAKETVKAIRAGKAGMSRLHLWSTRARSLAHGTAGASRRPAFPAPFLSREGEITSKARAKQAARMRRCVRC